MNTSRLKGSTDAVVFGSSFGSINGYVGVHERIDSRLIVKVVDARHKHCCIYLYRHDPT